MAVPHASMAIVPYTPASLQPAPTNLDDAKWFIAALACLAQYLNMMGKTISRGVPQSFWKPLVAPYRVGYYCAKYVGSVASIIIFYVPLVMLVCMALACVDTVATVLRDPRILFKPFAVAPLAVVRGATSAGYALWQSLGLSLDTSGEQVAPAGLQ